MPVNSGRTARWIPDQVRDDDHCGRRYVGPMPATPAWPPRSAPRLFVPGPLTMGATVSLEGNQAHYLAKVMRVAEGDTVVLCDDQTGEWAARVVATGKRDVVLEPVEKLREREPVPDVWLCPALLKKDRFDLVLDGHVFDPELRGALQEVRAQARSLRLFGSYPAEEKAQS